jgi:hypothetical protein
MQIEAIITVSGGHQISAPPRIGLSVDLDTHGHRLAPIFHESGGLIGAHQHIGIYFVDLYPRSKVQSQPGHSTDSSWAWSVASVIGRFDDLRAGGTTKDCR